MQIDWFTVIAQLLNFLILVWLLKRFLYKPVLDAIDAREKQIADALHHAATTEEQARTEKEKFQSLKTALEASRSTLIQEATDAADQEGQKLLGEARIAADALTEKRRQEQLGEVQTLRRQIHDLTASEVLALTRKILSGLADTGLEQSMIAVFTRHLQGLSEENRNQLVNALLSGESPCGSLCTSQPMGAEQQNQLQEAINAWAGSPVLLKFETSADLICGIQLSAQGQQLDWNIDVSLNQLDAALVASLGKTGNPASRAARTETANEPPR